MIDDLKQLNRLIASHWLGRLNAEQEAYLDHTRVCIGRLAHSTAELTLLLNHLKQESASALHVGELNRRYLTFVRLAAKEANAGRPDLLIQLGITLKQASWVRNLSDEDLDRLAFGISAPMIRFARRVFQRGVALHTKVGEQHAAALVSARPPVRGVELP
ncbi:MAG: hypothetical protein GEV05_19915 [Betaproteobacteria bacterium]|nr:hypothetical protein [Betaproteobacteria bacterium]